MRTRTRWPLLLALLTACGGESEGTAASTESTPAAAADALPMGTVEGVVRLAEGAEAPRYATSGVGGENPLPSECTPPSDADRAPFALAADRGLGGVPVVAMGDARHWPSVAAPSTVVARIHDCRLDPHVVTATVGDVLRIENDLVYPFFPTLAAGGSFNQAVLPGEPRELELDAARPLTLQCTIMAGCGRTEVLVFGHPVHTRSEEGGRFTLRVPADQDVELVAWHPLLEETSVHTRVAEGETVRVEVVVRPLPAPEPPPALPPGERPEDHPELGPF